MGAQISAVDFLIRDPSIYSRSYIDLQKIAEQSRFKRIVFQIQERISLVVWRGIVLSGNNNFSHEVGQKPVLEMIYTSDEEGNLIELESREKLHLTVSSKLHAAVIGMIQREDGKYLLQWRSAKKLGGSRLDVSATTHVRKSETYETALQRSFQKELHINETIPLEHLFDFRYTEDLGDHKENEFCKVYLGKYYGKYEPDEDEIDSIEFMTVEEMKEFVATREKEATKWLRETVKRM